MFATLRFPISWTTWVADLGHLLDSPFLDILSDESKRKILWDNAIDFYRFPGENHELSRSGSPVHRVQRAEIILDWFNVSYRTVLVAVVVLIVAAAAAGGYFYFLRATPPDEGLAKAVGILKEALVFEEAGEMFWA